MVDPLPNESPRKDWFAAAVQKVQKAWVGLDNKLAFIYEMLIAEHPRVLLAVLTLVWLFPGMSQFPFVDRDEPRFAYATQEMLDRNNSIVPTFSGQDRFDKPPLVYWWMMVDYEIFGYDNHFFGAQFSARLHSLLSTIVVVLLIWGFASRLYDREVGFWSAFAFLTCLQVFIHGRLCVADMPMMIFTVAALWALWELVHKSSWRWAVCFWVSLALGFSTKWIVPWAIVGVTFILYHCFKRQWPKLKNLKPLSGSILMLLIILSWAVPAWQQTDGDFFKIGLGQHVIMRGEEAFNARPYNPFYYILMAFVSLMPWLAFIGGLWGFLKSSFDDRAKFLTAWAAGTYFIFSIAQTQLPHYVMPAFPALLIMIVASTGLHKPMGLWAKRFYYFSLIFWGGILAVAALIVILLPLPDLPILRLKIAGLFLLVAFGGMVTLAWAKSRSKYLMLLVMFVCVPMLFWFGTLLIRHQTPAQKVAHILRNEELPPETLISCQYDEPSLVAYTQAPWLLEPDYKRAREDYEKTSSAALLVLSEEFTLSNIPEVLLNVPLKAHRGEWRQILKNPPKEGRCLQLEGLNLGRFSWVSYNLYVKP